MRDQLQDLAVSRRLSPLARLGPPGLVGLVGLVVACGTPPATSETAQALATFTNGSFETGDYTGWTLLEAPAGQPDVGTFGIATTGQPVTSPLFDHHDQITTTPDSPGLPLTNTATDGTQFAVVLQTGPHTQRMYQDIDVPACGASLRWDLAYQNHHTGFDPVDQYVAVNVRALDDTLLERPFVVDSGPLSMTTFTAGSVDLSAYAGQTVRLDFEAQVQLDYFDVAWDNIRVECVSTLRLTPATLDFGDVRVGTTSPEQSVDYANVNTVPLTLLSLTGSSSTVSFNPPVVPFTLDPNTASVLAVSFTPDRAGPFSETIEIAYDAPTSPAVITVTGTGVEAVASFNVSSIDFNPQPVGTTSTEKQALLTNTGTATMTVTAVTATPPFTITVPTTGFVLAPGESQVIGVTYTPTALGAVTGVVEITSDATVSPASFSLSGSGLGPPVFLDAPELTFAPQKVGTTGATRLVNIVNSGTSEVGFTGVTTTGPFAVVAPLTGFSLPPGQSATIEVSFTPTAVGVNAGTLSVASTDAGSPHEIPLTGFGTVGALVVTPGTLAFGDIRAGSRSLAQPLVVANQGDASVTVTQIAGPAGLVVSGRALPFGLLPGAQETLTVTFEPPVAGPGDGALQFTTTAGPGSVSVTARGVALALAADRPTIDVGAVDVGTASAAELVTLTNITAGPIRIQQATPRDGAVILDPAPPTGAIPPGGSVTLGLRFAPLTTGATSTGVDIVLDGVATPDVGLTLVGTGTGDKSSGCSAGAGASPWWLGVLGLGLVRRRRRR